MSADFSLDGDASEGVEILLRPDDNNNSFLLINDSTQQLLDVIKPSKQVISIKTGDGDDTVIIQGLSFIGAHIKVDTGGGDDQVYISDSRIDSNNIQIDTGNGNDIVEILDSAFEGASFDWRTGSGDDLLRLANSEVNASILKIDGGEGADGISLDGVTLDGNQARIKGSGGNDIISVTESVSQLKKFIIDTGKGDNRLLLDGITGNTHALDVSGRQGRSDFLQVQNIGNDSETLWLLDGEGSGEVNGIDFIRFEDLSGGDHNRDIFTIGPKGNLEGNIHGGLGGEDYLIVNDTGDGARTLTHVLTGSKDGSFFSADGDIAHHYTDFELIDFDTEADSHTVTLTAGANVILTQNEDGTLSAEIQHAFDAVTDLGALDGSDGFTVNSTDSKVALGTAVTRAGDINADGIDDIVVSDPGLDVAYAIFGTAGGFPALLDVASLDGTNGFVLTGPTGQRSGYAVGGGGDVNGDGIDDVIFGVPGPDGALGAGAAYVLFGSDAPFDASVDLTALDGTDGFVLNGIANGDGAGFAVAIVDDVNGDGLHDIFVGAPGADPDEDRVDAGQAYLVFGRDQGFVATLNLDDLDGIIGFALNGVNPGDQLGYAVAGAGDLNSDGLGDVILGAPGAAPNGDASGAAYVYFGDANHAVAEGFAGSFYATGSVDSLAEATAAIAGQLPDATFDAYQLDYPNSDNADTINATTLLSDFLGLNAEDISGGASSVIANAVFNFDGYLYVANPGTYTFEIGSAEGFSLSIDGQTVAEFDGSREFATSSGTHTFAEAGLYAISVLYYTGDDPAGIELKSDLEGSLDFITRQQLFNGLPAAEVELGTLDGYDGFAIAGSSVGDLLGSAVGAAGDLNVDGSTDIVVGAPGANNAMGAAYVVYGQSITTLDEGFEPLLAVSELDGSNGITFNGSVAGAAVGSAVGLAGDLNGDSLDDLYIGAPGDGSQAGSLHIVYASGDIGSEADFDLTTLNGVTGFTASTGIGGDQLGAAAAAVGDVNADGFDDLLIAAPGGNGSASVLFGRMAGGDTSTVNYGQPVSAFTLDGSAAGTSITIGNPESTSAPGDTENNDVLHFDGADFTARAHTVTVSDGVIISTRQVVSTGDDESDAASGDSIGDSGDITLSAIEAQSDVQNSRTVVTIGTGAALYAQVDEGSEYLEGDITITSNKTQSAVNLGVLSLSDNGTLIAHVTINDGVTILGGDIDISASAGIVDVEPLMKAVFGGAVDSEYSSILRSILARYAELASLPFSVEVSVVNARVRVGESGGDAVLIRGSGAVSIDADAHAEARGDAIFWTNPFSPGSSWGLAIGIWVADSTSRVTLHENVTVQSTEDDVKLAADASTNAGGAARVSQNLTQGLDINDESIPSNPNNIAVSVGISSTQTTAHVTVEEGAVVRADVGNVAITANGDDAVKIYPETRSYKDGRTGIAIGIEISKDDILARVDGAVYAGGAQHAEELDFDPFTALDTTNDTLLLGPDHGFETGDEIIYSPGLGGAVDGLQADGHYFIILDSNNPDRVQLAASETNAEQGIAIDLVDSPVLTTAEGNTLQLGEVDDINDWIDFGFVHGFATGDALTFTAADGKRIGGLNDGVTYYAVLVDGDNDGTLLQLSSDATGQNLIDFDTSLRFTVQSTGDSLVVDSVDEGPGTVTFTSPHGLQTGDAIEYDPAFGFLLADSFSEIRYKTGKVFYAIQSPSVDDPSQIDPYTIRLALTLEDALASNGYTFATDFAADQTLMLGTVHSLTPTIVSGITVSAEMDGEHIAESKARIGGKEGPEKKWTRPEFTNIATNIRTSLYNNPALNQVANSDVPNGMNADTGQDSLDASSALLFLDVNRTVKAIIGGTADLESGGDILVIADAMETGNAIAEAGATQSKDNDIKVEIGAAFTVANYDTTVRAIVHDGAAVDASGDIEIEATNERRFPAPVSSPEAFDAFLKDEFAANPSELLGDFNKPLLHPLFTTAWTYTHVDPKKVEDAAGFAIQYTRYHNVTEAIIAAGAQINQDETYRTEEQSVSVNALTDYKLVNMAGVFEFGLGISNLFDNLVDGAKYLYSKENFKRTSNPLVETGVEAENAAIGVTFLWTDIINRTVAEVGAPWQEDGETETPGGEPTGPARVHTGTNGSLEVRAHEEIWFFGFVDSGAKTESGSFAFAGSGLLFQHNVNLADNDSGVTRASIASGTIVSGGSVNVKATDELILVGQNGSVITGDNTTGVGASVSYWEVNRKVQAYIGDFNGDGTSASDFNLADGSAIDVVAASDGGIYSFSLAWSSRTSTPEAANAGGQVQGPDARDNNADPEDPEAAVGQGANAGQSGWSVAADVSYFDLKNDQVLAFIDDIGAFTAGSVSVKATNNNNLVSAVGAFSVLNVNYKSSGNLGLAGSFAGLSIVRGSTDSLGRGKSDTLAYIRRAMLNIKSDGLALRAERKGVYWMTAAGGASIARSSGSGFVGAGSAAWNDLHYVTRAYIEDVSSLQLVGDASLKSSDGVATVAFAGDGVFGGSIGFGTAWAWNHVDRRIEATIDNTVITQSAGSLTLDAVLWDVASNDGATLLPSAWAVAATLGVGNEGSAELNGTIAVNEFNTATSGDAVRTALTNSSYTHSSGAGETLSLSATDNSNLLAYAGALDLGANFTLGVAAAVNTLDDTASAVIEHSNVAAGGADVSLAAQINPEMNAFALGVAVTDQTTGLIVAGSGAANRTTLSADAHVLGTVDSVSNVSDTKITAAGDITIDARVRYTDVTAGAGAFGIQALSGNFSVDWGAAVAVNDLAATDVKAYVQDSPLTAFGDIAITATSDMADDGIIMGLAVGLQTAQNFTLGGSVVSNNVGININAYISGDQSVETTGGFITVTAKEQDLVVVAGAGMVNVVSGAAAVGAAVANNMIDTSATAYVDATDLTARGAVTIAAERKNPQVVAVSVGGEFADSFSLGGSVANNHVNHSAVAYLSGGSQVDGSLGVSVLAEEDDPLIVAAAGNVSSATGGLAIGAAVPTNTVNRTLNAYVGNSNSNSFADSADGTSVTADAGAITIKATRSGSLLLGIGVSGVGAETFAAGGSIVTNNTSSTVNAHAWGVTLDARDDITIHAADNNATQAAGSGNVDINYLSEASGSGEESQDVDGLEYVNEASENALNENVGNQAIADQSLRVNDLLEEIQDENPADEAANGLDNSSELSENLNDEINEVNNESVVGEPPAVAIEQTSTTSADEPLGDTIGSFGIALANNTITSSNVKAFASDATLISGNQDIDVRAKQDALLVTISGSGSGSADGVSVNVTEAATVYNPITHAYIVATDDNPKSSVSANGNVLVGADSNLHGVTVAGNFAFNESGTSVALTAATLEHTDHTEAWIDQTDVTALANGEDASVDTGVELNRTTDDAFRGVSVTATSKETLTTVAAGIDLGATSANRAASVTINLLTETTTAKILDAATVNSENDDAGSGQQVNVLAWSDTTINGGAGAVGLSGGKSWGGGASAEGANITKTTEAFLNASTVNATDNVSVQALSREKTASWVATVEGSAAGSEIAAAASIYIFDLTTKAEIGSGVTLVTDGSVLLAADDHTRTNVFSGTLTGTGGNGSLGASVGLVHLGKTTTATVIAGADVTAHGTTDPVSAIRDGFDVSYTPGDGDPTEVQPPGIVTVNNFDDSNQSPVNDQAYLQSRNASGKFIDLHGVAVTATGLDVVKGEAWGGSGAAKAAFEVIVLGQTGTRTTTAAINGSVTAGDGTPDGSGEQDVLVSAHHDYHQLAVTAGLAIGGKFAAYPGVSWSVVNYNTHASIGTDAIVTSDRDTWVVAKGTEHLTVISAGFAVSGGAGIDAQVAVNVLTNSVTANVWYGAKIDAGGNVLVSAQDNTHATHISGGVAFGAQGSLGAGVVYFDIDKTITARIAGSSTDSNGDPLAAASVTGRGISTNSLDVLDGVFVSQGTYDTESIQGVAVQANSLEDVQGYAISGAAGEYVGVAGSVLYTHIHSTTDALVGSDAQVNQGTGETDSAQSVSIGASNVATVTNFVGGFAGSGGALAAAFDVGIVRNNTTAQIGRNAAVSAAQDVEVHALGSQDVTTTAISSADGGLGLEGSGSIWTLGKKLESTYDTVSTTGNNSLDLSGSPNYQDFGSYAGGQTQRQDVSSALSAYDDDGSGIATIGSTAGSTMDAATPSPSEAQQQIASDETGGTNAQILPGAVIVAGNDIAVTSEEQLKLVAFTGSFSLDIASLGASVALAQVRGGAVAAAAGTLSAGNDITVSAAMTGHYDSTSAFGSGGTGEITNAVALVEDHSIQSASLDDGTTVLLADSVNVTADRDYTEFSTRTVDVGVGGAAVGAAVAQSKVFGSTAAFAGNVDFSDPTEDLTDDPTVGDVTITATSKASPTARADAYSFGILAGDGNRADARVTPTVDAHYGSGSGGIARISGDMKITANSSAEPNAEGYGVAVGFTTVGVSQTTAAASPAVNAYVADNATIRLYSDGEDGELAVTANTVEDPTSHGRASGGGIASGDGVDSVANIRPVVSAWLGAGVDIQTDLGVKVLADDSWVGTAIASGDDIAGLAVNINNATLTIEPQVSAWIGFGPGDEITDVTTTVASVNDAVTVQAFSGEAGSLPELSFDPTTIDYENNIIIFEEAHGLETGDSVIYDSRGLGVVGGLENGESYLVERINDKAIRFVYQFDSADVDPATSLIYADTPHGIETGSPVIYDNGGFSDIVNLTNNQIYYVNAVDPNNLRLATSQEIADNLRETSFDIVSNLNTNNTIDLNIAVQGEVHHGKANNGEHHITLDTAPGWADGQAIYYFASDGVVIESLTVGGLYYVQQDSGSDRNFTLYTDPELTQRISEFKDNREGNFVVPTDTWRAAGEGLDSPENQFGTINVDFDADTITFTDAPVVSTGDIVGLESKTTPIEELGLSGAFYYFAHITESAGKTIVQLALTQEDLANGIFVDLVGNELTADNVFELTRPYTIATGDALTYRAPLEVHFIANDLANGNIIVDFSDATSLFEDLIAYGENLPLLYSIASTFDSAAPINGLVDGEQYFVNAVQTDIFELTLTVSDLDGNVLNLTSMEDADTGTPVDHVLTMQGHGAIGGLEDGNTYYMITHPNHPGRVSFALSEADAEAGNAITIFDAGGRLNGDASDGGTHFLGIEGIGIMPPSSNTGIQSLVIDLTNSGVIGEQGFIQAGATEDVDTISGNPTVKAHGTNGDLVGGIGTNATATIKPVVSAWLGSADDADTAIDLSITAVDFELQSQSFTSIKGESIGFDISVGAGGGSSTVDLDLLNTALVSVSTGTAVSTSGDVTIVANSGESIAVSTDMVSGGLADGSGAYANLKVGRDTNVTFGAGTEDKHVSIDAAGDVMVKATSLTEGTATAKAHAYGGLAIAVPRVDFQLGHDSNYPAETQVVLGDYTHFTADTLEVSVRADHNQLKSTANARTGDLFGGSNLDAKLRVKDFANLTIGEQVTSTTTNNKSVAAVMSYLDTATGLGSVSAQSDAKSRTLIGGDYAAATTDLAGGVVLDGQFADSIDDYQNYNLEVTNSDDIDLVEHHKSVTYYVWFIKDKHEGGSATYNLTIDTDQAPATLHTISNGAQIEAENFDIGGEGQAYHDSVEGNQGGEYRLGEDVDIKTSSDIGGGFDLVDVRDGEWVEFTTNVTAGSYDITVRAASNRSLPPGVSLAGEIKVEIGDGNSFTTLGSVPISFTGGWQNWMSFTLQGITIDGGTDQVLRLVMIDPYGIATDNLFNLNWIRFD